MPSETLSTRGNPWRTLLAAEQAAKAVAVSQEIASRLQYPDQVEVAHTLAAQQTAFPRSVQWEPYGVANGFAGLALTCGYLDSCFPDEGWDTTGHHYLTLGGQEAEQPSYLPPGLFAGLSGLAFVAWCLSRNGIRYQKLLKAIEEVLLPEAVALAEDLSQEKQGIPVSQFDVISGVSGVGAYLLCRRDMEEADTALQAILHSLVALTGEEDGILRWHTPAHYLMGDETITRLYPYGNLNCGLAHGLPGPLALMALAFRFGIEVKGLIEAIERAAIWLDRNRVDDRWGVNWPYAVPLRPAGASTPDSSTPLRTSRTAWCYGSPGVARALWLAGKALDHPGYCELAVEAMKAVYQRPLWARGIDSPTFCHGVAGLLQITLRFANDTGLPLFAKAAETLSEQLLSLYDPDTLLGYYSLEPGGQRVDQPGLLDGAPGVVLVLLAAATDVEPTWDRLFLLA